MGTSRGRLIGLGVLAYPMLTDGVTLGSLAALLGALVWAIGTVYLKWANVQAEPLTITAWQLLTGTLPIFAIFNVSGDPVFMPDASVTTWIGITYATFCGTALAYLVWFKVVQDLPASVAGLGMLFVPVAAMLAGVVMLSEKITLVDAAAFGCIFLAGLLAIGRIRSSRTNS